MVKRLSWVVVAIVALVLMGGVIGLIWWRGAIAAPEGSGETVRFVITKGSSSEKIGSELEEADLIKSALAFKFYLQFNGLSKKIPPGEFSLTDDMALSELVDKLLEGPTQVWVTVPEGLRREEIALRITESLELGSAFTQEFLAVSSGMEGFLFPDTYLVPRDVTATNVVNLMRTTFDKKHGGRVGESGLSLDEVVTLASIIERETVTDEERPIVAGIYLKRIGAGWGLDADATLQYAEANEKCSVQNAKCDWWPRPVTPAMKEIESPYNTYKYPGLPPGPLGSPGLSSLNAVVEPKESEYWFYLHDSDGVIRYGRTLEEHNSNVRRYLR